MKRLGSRTQFWDMKTKNVPWILPPCRQRPPLPQDRCLRPSQEKNREEPAANKRKIKLIKKWKLLSDLHLTPESLLIFSVRAEWGERKCQSERLRTFSRVSPVSPPGLNSWDCPDEPGDPPEVSQVGVLMTFQTSDRRKNAQTKRIQTAQDEKAEAHT